MLAFSVGTEYSTSSLKEERFLFPDGLPGRRSAGSKPTTARWKEGAHPHGGGGENEEKTEREKTPETGCTLQRQHLQRQFSNKASSHSTTFNCALMGINPWMQSSAPTFQSPSKCLLGTHELCGDTDANHSKGPSFF